MSWINNLRLQPKLLGGFSLVLALMVTIAVIAAREFSSSSSDVQHMYEHEVDGIQNVLLTNWAYTASARDLRGAALTNDAPTRSATLKRATDELKQGQDAFTKYEATLDTEEERQQVAELKQLVTQTTATRQKALDAMLAGDIDGGLKLEMDQTDTVVRQNTLLDEAGARAEAAARTRAGDLTSATSSAQRMVIVVSVVAVLLGLGIAFYLARRIKSDVALVSSRMKSIEENCLVSLEQGIKAVEEGNLLVAAHPVTPKIDHCAKDELGEMATTINGMIDKLVSTMGSYNAMRDGLCVIVSGVGANATSILTASEQLQEASDQMAAATGQIATAINEVTRSTVALSGLSQDSSREIEQVAAGSQELAANARANTDSATSSRDEALRMGDQIARVAKQSEAVAATANESRQAAVEGQRAIQQAVASMESIASAVERSSQTVDRLGEYGQQIGDIVKVIDEIAAQTNLLALNAAIEAARAGEQGRGFAVVADNVRSLAERSSQSTREIADLISKVQSGTSEAVEAMALGVKDVNDGRAITTQAGEALEAIIASVQSAAGQMQAIANDVQGLSAGAEKIVGGAEAIARGADSASTSAAAMAEATGRVTEAILQVSATSEQTSASAEEVSASTEELSAQSEELSATAQAMREMAEELNAAASRFTWQERKDTAPSSIDRRRQARGKAA